MCEIFSKESQTSRILLSSFLRFGIPQLYLVYFYSWQSFRNDVFFYAMTRCFYLDMVNLPKMRSVPVASLMIVGQVTTTVEIKLAFQDLIVLLSPHLSLLVFLRRRIEAED